MVPDLGVGDDSVERSLGAAELFGCQGDRADVEHPVQDRRAVAW
jgi:hypothetical protein